MPAEFGFYPLPVGTGTLASPEATSLLKKARDAVDGLAAGGSPTAWTFESESSTRKGEGQGDSRLLRETHRVRGLRAREDRHRRRVDQDADPGLAVQRGRAASRLRDDEPAEGFLESHGHPRRARARADVDVLPRRRLEHGPVRVHRELFLRHDRELAGVRALESLRKRRHPILEQQRLDVAHDHRTRSRSFTCLSSSERSRSFTPCRRRTARSSSTRARSRRFSRRTSTPGTHADIKAANPGFNPSRGRGD